jgi:hypothetical protein
MRSIEKRNYESRSMNHPHSAHLACLLSCLVPMLCLAGCGSSPAPASATESQSNPQTYFAPYVAGTSIGGTVVNMSQAYTFDDSAPAPVFSQSTYQLSPDQDGAQVITSGATTALPRGLLSLGITAEYTNSTGTWTATVFPPNTPQLGSWAVELADQSGGLVQLLGQPVTPLVAATQCPSNSAAQTYQFVTIPAALMKPAAGAAQVPSTWNPATETAYGSVAVSASGGTVNFSNIQQFTLPSVGGSGVPAQAPPTAVAGMCGSTFFGNTIVLPGQLVITDPGSSGTTAAQATVGIGSSGLLVEDNGVITNGADAGDYQNALGAGTGAVGLPQPSSQVNTATLLSSQYLGFIYGAGVYGGNANAPTGWTSNVASFGFPTTPTTCASVAASTGTLIYGGDFSGDNPAAATSGYGNCDLAIDLGTQDAANNGLYPHATMWVGGSFAANKTKANYSFPAVAIAGQLNGKYAIFVLGVDSTQPWAIYLLQSN